MASDKIVQESDHELAECWWGRIGVLEVCNIHAAPVRLRN